MVKVNTPQQLVVRLPAHEYPIIIGNNILSDDELLRKYIKSKQVLIVTNETIAPLYLQSIESAFAGLQVDKLILKDGEFYKNQQSLTAIYDVLITQQHHRDTTLVALGGGVIGDITGFAAATFQRGVSFLQIPTTLLAQIDASVGGKTAINHPQAKNMIGSFHQPDAVFIDLATLKTLPLREYRAGLAEAIKYGLLEGDELMAMLGQALNNGLATNNCEQLPQIITRCCQIKTEFVQKDERESGDRALLNLGHTFAHALEAYTQYNRWLHGEAVAIGLYCAALLSHHHGVLEKKWVVLLDELLTKAHLPRRIPREIDLKRLRELMSQDKKIKNKKLHFVLMKAAGECYVDDNVSEECLDSALQSAVDGD